MATTSKFSPRMFKTYFNVTEGLTKQRMKLLNEVQKVIGEGNLWTVDDFIFMK